MSGKAAPMVWANRLARARARLGNLSNARQCTAALQEINKEFRALNVAFVTIGAILAEVNESFDSNEEET